MIEAADLLQATRLVPVLWNRYAEERKRTVLAAPHRPHPEAWPVTGLHAAWLGHSTVLLQIDGFRILTDPVFSERIGIGFGPITLGIKRLVMPALEAAEIPRADLILLSHAHMDHFDLPSLRALESQEARVVTASKTTDLLREKHYRDVDELAWGETAQVGDVLVRAFEVNHWGARMRSDTYRGYNGYLIETPRYRVLFAGDTAITGTFKALRSTRKLDLAIMPIGAYNPWIRAHCTPEQALQMANDAGADRILPVHHQTFQLSSEPTFEPIERLSSALAGDTGRLVLTEIGQQVSFEN